MNQRWFVRVLLGGLTWSAVISSSAEEPGDRLSIEGPTRDRCRAVLRAGLTSDEFWPAMHAAEAMTLNGDGAAVRAALAPRLATEADDQRRCGLARELVRAGDLSYVSLLLDVLAKRNTHGHVHACESLFKVWQVGDGELLRRTLADAEPPKLAIMAAAALARWGNRQAVVRLREYVRADDGETARTAAWVLARVGGATDLPELRRGAQRFKEPLTRAYFEHALAALGDAEGKNALIRNLGDSDPMLRVYAAEFAPDARALGAKDSLIRLLDDPVLDVRVRAAQALLQLAGPASPSRQEDIRRDLFVATVKNPRYSEGSVIVLRDGRLLCAMTEFEGSPSDFAAARIVGVESSDEGRSWGPPRVLQENVGRQNVMSATLRRLAGPLRFDGPIGLFSLLKNEPDDLQVFLRVSEDEGTTFGPSVRVTNTPGYHVLNNDRVTVLSSGRLVVPVASAENVERGGRFTCACLLSDDRGHTWRRSRNEVPYAKRGAMEPEVIELRGGRLLMHFRTQVGHIAVSESADGGESWSEAKHWGVRSPEAPATLRRIPSTGDLLLIWNDTYTGGVDHGGKRTPLTAAVSADEGRTWSFRRNLETDDQHTFAYTSVVFHRGRALLTYYVRDEATGRISSRFRSVPIGWFYEAEGPG